MVEVNGPNYQTFINEATRIDDLLRWIRDDTSFHSRMNAVLEHEAFGKLVAMGDRIIPYLFYVTIQRGASWTIFLLLHKITGENPVPENDAGKFGHTLMHWLRWWIDSKYHDSDVYCGLVD